MSTVARIEKNFVYVIVILFACIIPVAAFAGKTVFLKEPKIQIDYSPKFKESVQQEINGRIKSAISKMASDVHWQIKNSLNSSPQTTISGDLSNIDYLFNFTVVASDFIYGTHKNPEGRLTVNQYPYFKMDIYYEVVNNKTNVILANKKELHNGKSILADQSLPTLLKSYSQSFGSEIAQNLERLPEPTRIATPTPPSPSANTSKKVYALLFGVSNYKDPQLSFSDAYPAEDIKQMKAFIENSHGYDDFSIESKYDNDANRTGILQPIYDLRYRATEQDTVIIYFSGHGGVDLSAENNMFIVPYDFDRSLPSDKSIYSEELKKQLKSLKAKNIFLILDACHSGAFIDNGQVQIDRGQFKSVGLTQPQIKFFSDPTNTKQGPQLGSSIEPVIYVLTSSGSNQLSATAPKHKQSDFTYHLLQGMNGSADDDKDGRIMAAELVNFITQEMRREGSPQVSFPSSNTANLSVLDRRPDKKYHLYLDPLVNWLTPSRPTR